MKLTEKAKKRLTVAGLGVVCIALLIAIYLQFKPEAPTDISVQSSSSISNSITSSTPPEESSWAPKISAKPIETTVVSVQSIDTGGSTGTEQKIQAEVTKPSEPLQEELIDPSKTPDGEKVDKVKKPESNATSSTPKSGDKKAGKIYVPGFGWIDDNGGGGSGTTAGDMYENGNKIGNMD